jgi:Lon protease-like protein
VEIPLFPLPSLVLFPHAAVPLHIFEERYKLMINTCIDRNEAFGLVLLRGDGEEETAEMIHRVGVVARIVQVERLDEGRMNVICVGEARFRIQRFSQQSPYWKASVDLFPEEDTGLRDASLFDRVAEAYQKVLEMTARLTGMEYSEATIPETPTELSFLVSYILEIDAEQKQDLLEMTSTSERMQALMVHLQEAIRRLEQQLAEKALTAKARNNGDLRKSRPRGE